MIKTNKNLNPKHEIRNPNIEIRNKFECSKSECSKRKTKDYKFEIRSTKFETPVKLALHFTGQANSNDQIQQ